MNREEILEKIKCLVSDQFGIKVLELNDGTNFQSDLSADSLDAVEIIMQTEDVFDLKIPDEDADSILTIGSLVDYVEKRLKEND